MYCLSPAFPGRSLINWSPNAVLYLREGVSLQSINASPPPFPPPTAEAGQASSGLPAGSVAGIAIAVVVAASVVASAAALCWWRRRRRRLAAAALGSRAGPTGLTPSPAGSGPLKADTDLEMKSPQLHGTNCDALTTGGAVVICSDTSNAISMPWHCGSTASPGASSSHADALQLPPSLLAAVLPTPAAGPLPAGDAGRGPGDAAAAAGASAGPRGIEVAEAEEDGEGEGRMPWLSAAAALLLSSKGSAGREDALVREEDIEFLRQPDGDGGSSKPLVALGRGGCGAVYKVGRRCCW